MANDICRARSLHEVKKAPVCIKITMSRNSCNDSINNRLFSVRAYAMEEYKWESRWNTQLAPSARRTNFPVSFWASDTLKWRQFGCQVDSSRMRTSVRYLIGIATASRLVSMLNKAGLSTSFSYHMDLVSDHFVADHSHKMFDRAPLDSARCSVKLDKTKPHNFPARFPAIHL